MKLPWLNVAPMSAATVARIRRRLMFEFCKWDVQCEDSDAVADRPIVLRASAWAELARLAETLAAETMAAEAELLGRPALWKQLGIPRGVRRALKRAGRLAPAAGIARLIRFDFHFTTDGWRISEANTDVPGGFNEASGLSALVAPHYPGAAPLGDPTAALLDAVLAGCVNGGAVALVHATAYSDDRQVMIYLARQLASRGRRGALVAPDQLAWRDGQARIAVRDAREEAAVLMRFFPAEWLPNLPRRSGWQYFFAGSRTPASNPAAALLTQTKRFPLVWDALSCRLDAWRALLPETRDPRAADWMGNGDWVLKPACGRVGEGIGMPGVTDLKEWREIIHSVRRWPGEWVAQRRFEPVAIGTGDAALYPCVGVYTVDGRVAGAYGRLGRQPLIGWQAQDAAVLVAGSPDARGNALTGGQP
jgi:glutathionylspermidine synthase